MNNNLVSNVLITLSGQYLLTFLLLLLIVWSSFGDLQYFIASFSKDNWIPIDYAAELVFHNKIQHGYLFNYAAEFVSMATHFNMLTFSQTVLIH